MKNQSKSNSMILTVPRIIRPNEPDDFRPVWDAMQSLAALNWQQWLCSWVKWLDENQDIPKVRLRKRVIEDTDGYLFCLLDVNVAMPDGQWESPSAYSGMSSSSNPMHAKLSGLSDSLFDRDLNVLHAAAMPCANDQLFLQEKWQEFKKEDFLELLRESWGDEASLVQEEKLKELIAAPSQSKPRLKT